MKTVLDTSVKQIGKELARKQSQQGILSFGNGIKNVLGARHTGQTVRLRVINNWDDDVNIILTPQGLLGGDLPKANPTGVMDLSEYGLPDGIPFYMSTVSDGSTPAKKVTIASLNPGQKLRFIGSELTRVPMQITSLSMKSFTTRNSPENTNYGNSLTHYKVSALKETLRSTPLNFDRFQGAKDFSTEILKIDLIKENFNAIISQNDVLTMQVNAGTRMDITFQIGARLNLSEYFYRQTKAGNEVLLGNFPTESSVNPDCGCN